MNNVSKMLSLTLLVTASAVAYADWNGDCSNLDSYSNTVFQSTYGQAQAPVPNPPGFCSAVNTTISKYYLNTFIPPGACVDYKQLETFTWGQAATLPASSCGGNSGVVEKVESGGGANSGAGSSSEAPPTTW